MKWNDVLGVISSVATITGVSLLWIGNAVKDWTPLQAAHTAALATTASLFTLGFLYGVIQLLARGHRACDSLEARVLYWCFGGGIAVLLGFYILMTLWMIAATFWQVEIS